MNKKSNVFVWIDLVKLIAIILVIQIHTASPLMHQYNVIEQAYWWIGVTYDSIARMSVPLFFMATGFLLLNKQESISIFFYKRVKKILIPLLAWSLIYTFFRIYYDHNTSISWTLFIEILYKPSYFHLWFLYAIIALYLYIPILRILIQKVDNNILYYFILIWFVTVGIIPFLETIYNIKTPMKYYLTMFSGYSGYLLLGFLLGQLSFTKMKLYISFLIYLTSLFATILGTYYLTEKESKYIGYFDSYTSPNVIFLAISSFLLIKFSVENLELFRHQKVINFIALVSSSSFGIYLIHIIFYRVFSNGDFGITLNVFVGNPLWIIPVKVFTIFIFSLFSVLLLQKIPYINKII